MEAEERNRRQHQEFMIRANQPYNFTQQSNNDMYGASNPGPRPNQNASYGQGQTNLSNTGQSFEFSPTKFNANSNSRPPVVSEGGCCCSVM